jgi:hypothetical protein
MLDPVSMNPDPKHCTQPSNPNFCRKKLPHFLSVEKVSKMHFLPTAAVAKRQGGTKKHSAAIGFPFKVLLKKKQHM